MNQENNFNSQGNNGMPNNQPLNNQNLNNTFNQNIYQSPNGNQPQSAPNYQQPINQMNMQQPALQPMNTFDSGNVNNQNLHNIPPKKKNLGLIIGITAIVVAATVIAIFAFSGNNDKPEQTGGIPQNIKYSASNERYIIEKIDVTEKSTINIPSGKGLFVTDSNGNVINLISEPGNFNIVNNSNNHYYISLLEHFINIESNIERDKDNYNYNFRVRFRISDPIKMLEKITIKDSIKMTELFKNMFDEIFKKNLNNFIIDFVKENNISLEELSSSNIDSYLLKKIQTKVDDEYNGVEIGSLSLQSITKTEILQNDTSNNNKEYLIGDKIKFNNEYWYVIENSSKEKDYVVVLKERILDKKMKLLESVDDNYPYSQTDTRFYEKSDIKTYLENDYINEIGINNLKEINGYKIRLITVEELCNNLVPNSEAINFYEEKNSRGCYLYHEENSNVAPEWVYLTSIVGTDSYWTMSYAYGSGNYKVSDYVSSMGSHVGAMVSGSFVSEIESEKGIRPVVNLLKSSIQQ